MYKNSLHILKNNIRINNHKFALIIGSNPSSGAKSPKLWNKVYKFQKSKIKMFPADVEKKNLSKLINILKNDNLFIGGSVTVPYKETIIKYLDHIDEMSKKIGAINTIIKKGNKLVGLNTDYLGFTKSLKKMSLKKNDKILIIGCGGVAKAVITSVIRNYKNNKKIFFNRSQNKIKNFLKNFNKKNIKTLNNYNEIQNLRDIKLVINATAVGFDTWFSVKKNYFNLKYFSPISNSSNFIKINKKSEKSFVKENIEVIKSNILNSFKFFKNNPKCKVIDVVHTPEETVLMQLSSQTKMNGVEMNLDQAVYAFKEVNEFKSFEKLKKIMKDK